MDNEHAVKSAGLPVQHTFDGKVQAAEIKWKKQPNGQWLVYYRTTIDLVPVVGNYQPKLGKNCSVEVKE
jgi:hypothetical protein